MHAFIVVSHIACMVASLTLMPTAAILALRGLRTSIKLAKSGTVTTAIGVLLGTILLFESPILSECIILTSYLAVVIAVYAIGFGWGVEAKARLLRQA